jgi:hypothetical protein
MERAVPSRCWLFFSTASTFWLSFAVAEALVSGPLYATASSSVGLVGTILSDDIPVVIIELTSATSPLSAYPSKKVYHLNGTLRRPEAPWPSERVAHTRENVGISGTQRASEANNVRHRYNTLYYA